MVSVGGNRSNSYCEKYVSATRYRHDECEFRFLSRGEVTGMFGESHLEQ